MITSLLKTFLFTSIFLIITAPGPTYGQVPARDLQFEQLTINNESLQHSVNCMYQDKKGYLWFGSWSGLYKYDAHKLTLYKPDNNKKNAIKDRKIRKIFEDSKGNLWIGTMHEGLHKFDREKEEFIQYKHNSADLTSISNNDVTDIFEDRSGNIWVGTVDGLNLLITEKWNKREASFKATFRRYQVQNENFAYDRVNMLFQDKKDRIWIAAETGLYYYNSKSDSKWPFIKFVFPSEDSYSEIYYNDNHIYSLIETESKASETVLWVGTRGGLKKVVIDDYSAQWFKTYTIQEFSFDDKIPDGISNDRIRSLYQSKMDKNSIWIGTEDGLNRMELTTGKFHVYKTDYKDPNSICNNLIYTIYEDRSGVLWFGTEKGATKIDLFKKNFQLYQATENENNTGLSDNYVTSISAGGKSDLWVGTSSGGLNRVILDPVTGFPRQINEIKFAGATRETPHYIYSVCRDNKGQIWLSTNGEGVYRFNESDVKGNIVRKFTHFSSNSKGKNYINDDYILSTYQSSDGSVWIGAWNEGLSWFDVAADKFVPLKNSPEIPAEAWKHPVSSIVETKDGKIWMGTRGGGVFSFQLKKNKWTYNHFSKDKRSLSNDFVNFILEDKQRNIWVGTEGGLSFLQKASYDLKIVSEEDGLPSDILQSVIEDRNGNFWISTNKGLSKLTIQKNQPGKYIIRNYDRADGLQGDIFNNNASAITADGMVVFGGINGLNAFYPEDILNNNKLPQVEITNLLIFNKEVPIGKRKAGKEILRKSVNETSEIEVDYDDNSISLEFASLHFASPGKNQYAYRMIGFDEDWVYSKSSRNIASYTNLDPGNYRFEVKASNNDGVWSLEVATLSIKINPPFWKTPLAYFAYILLVLFILYLLRSWLLMKVSYRHNLHLERVKREQLEVVNQLKIKFFTNISHEIRTPLTLILGSLERVINTNDLNAKIHNQLLVMQKNGNMMLRLISELLDFRKLESGHLGLRAAEGNIVNYLNEVFVAFRDLAYQRQIIYKFESQKEVISLFYDREKLEKVIYNLLSNAFKFTKDNGHISLSIDVAKSEEISQILTGKKCPIFNVPYVKIKVKDNGIGIPTTQIERIFDVYYQAESSDPYHQNTGTGIGLSLTKSLVELHKGFITVESDEGRGSAFTVYLPCGSGHLGKEEVIKDFKGSEDKNHYSSVNIKGYETFKERESEHLDQKDTPLLLIVEDNSDVRNFIKQCFEDEYRVILASNGSEGLKAATEKIPDLIISDVIMPEMDGLEFCRRIKESEKTSHIPLILLTARTSLIYKTEGLETGADDYITKPFNAQVLTLKVRNLIKLKQNLNQKFGNKKYLKPVEIATNSVDEIFLSKAIECVSTQMHNPDFTTEDLGNALAMSRMQLYRKLKALTGLTPIEFIRSQRIQRAAQLIEKSQLTIAEITYEVGFNDLKYFRKCFKEYYKVNPSDYKNSEARINFGLSHR